MKTLISIGLTAGLAICLSTAAKASPVTLTYTGNNFTFATSPYTTSDKVTGTVDLASPLGDNLSDVFVTPLSFSFSDGAQTFTSADSLFFATFEFSTDSTGTITNWNVGFATTSAQTNTIGTENVLGGKIQDVGGDNGGEGAIFASPGSWSLPTNSVPEPLTLSLFVAGLVGAAAIRKRKAK